MDGSLASQTIMENIQQKVKVMTNPASSPEDFNISQMPAETHRQTGQFKTTAHILIGLDNVSESRKCNKTVGHGKASVRSQTVLSSMQNGTVGRTELWGLFFPGAT